MILNLVKCWLQDVGHSLASGKLAIEDNVRAILVTRVAIIQAGSLTCSGHDLVVLASAAASWPS